MRKWADCCKRKTVTFFESKIRYLVPQLTPQYKKCTMLRMVRPSINFVTLFALSAIKSAEIAKNLGTHNLSSWQSILIHAARVGESSSKQQLASFLREDVYLSVVIVIRNDDYGGRQLDRFLLSISSLSVFALVYKLRMELIVVEWNPPTDGQPRIIDAVSWPETIQNLSVVTVEHSVHEQLGYQGWEYEGKNLGVSLAKGRFVLTTNADILFSEGLVKYISRRSLREDCFYRVDRHDVVDSVSLGGLPGADLERLLEIHSIRRLRRWGIEWHPLPDGPAPHVEGREGLEAYRADAASPPPPSGERVDRLGAASDRARPPRSFEMVVGGGGG